MGFFGFGGGEKAPQPQEQTQQEEIAHLEQLIATISAHIETGDNTPDDAKLKAKYEARLAELGVKPSGGEDTDLPTAA